MTYHLKTIYKRMLADQHTPVTIYNKLRDQFPNALLLESADYHNRSDSKSFICLAPMAGFEAQGKTYEYQLPNHKTIQKQAEHPREVFAAFQMFVSKFISKPCQLPFKTQGLWGYSSFEAVQYMEDIVPAAGISELKNNPDLKYQLFQFVLVFDHFKNELFISQNAVNAPIDTEDEIDRIQQILQKSGDSQFTFQQVDEETSNVSDEQFKDMVNTGIHHCKVGDTFQVVLSRAFEQKFKGDDFNLYRCLRSINPSPYLFYFDYGDFKIFGSSPESQLQIDNGVASISPIAGTVLRSDHAQKDARLAAELKQNKKEMAEHVMLVDLARNDLSKGAECIEIESYAEAQYFSHVIHLVSKVNGVLLKTTNALDVYADTFPAGTLSGAPKYKALEIIAKTENTSRNFYGGAIGFIGFDGSINHAIIIRSVLSKNNTLVYQAGAGVVSESTAEGELQEVNNKIAAIRSAIKNASEL